jgi:hypothetical protein
MEPRMINRLNALYPMRYTVFGLCIFVFLLSCLRSWALVWVT